MTTCLVDRCGQPAGDTYVCNTCTQHLAADLASLPELVAELDVTLSRQHRFTAPNGITARSAEKPVPFHQAASHVRSALKTELIGWCASLAETGHWGDAPSNEDMLTCADWLYRHLTDIRLHPAVGELCDALWHATTAVRRIIDRPPDSWYAGACSCGADMYARATVGTVSCPSCGTEYDVETRRAELLEALSDQLATAEEVSHALTALGQEITPERIRRWVTRGKLTQRPAHPGDARKRPRYQIGEVVTLLR
ncbi:hypothetical protein [Actinopolyspora halophila]|uniref:hypothetical protein n=1 Tax=Actinopolyspora halophila TaxID=1850 RepID=UPI00035EE68D|nr:hypothetical protein [Actinopolyspora halophila]